MRFARLPSICACPLFSSRRSERLSGYPTPDGPKRGRGDRRPVLHALAVQPGQLLLGEQQQLPDRGRHGLRLRRPDQGQDAVPQAEGRPGHQGQGPEADQHPARDPPGAGGAGDRGGAFDGLGPVDDRRLGQPDQDPGRQPASEQVPRDLGAGPGGRVLHGRHRRDPGPYVEKGVNLLGAASRPGSQAVPKA